MRNWWILIVGVILLPATKKQNAPEDEQAIRKVLADETAAWNRHEGSLNGAFTQDFDVVIATGDYIAGKPNLQEAFSTILKNAHKIDAVDRIRFIRPDVALVDGRFEISGTDIQPYPKGLLSCVLVKENGRWAVTANRQMVPVVAPPAIRTAPTKHESRNK